ncbi:MAG: M12 family metallo-peptidase [Pseudomonadota bacterium]
MNKKFVYFVMLSLCSLGARAATTVDVLIIYTSEMNTYYSGNPAVKINQMISWANVAFQNGLSDINLNLVGSAMLDVPNGHEVSNALISGIADPANAAVMRLRNQFKPDLTIYLTKSASTASSILCGLAYLPRSAGDPRVASYDKLLSVATVGYNCESYVFAHEVGHLLGAGHGLMDASGGSGYPYKYSRGYGVQSLFVDVMAYASLYGNANKIQIFSTPTKTCAGVSCGTANDNAAAGLRLFAPIAANYSTCYPTVTSPRAPGYHFCR